MAELSAATPLGAMSHAVLTSAGHAQTVLIRELPLSGAIALRVERKNERAIELAAEALGIALPTEPNISVAAPDLHVLWQAYDEWLIVTVQGKQHALETELRSVLSGLRSAVTDVSD